MLFLRGLHWRRGYSAAVLLVGTLCAAVAAIGPLYARAAGESTLTDSLTAAAPATGLVFNRKADLGDAHSLAELRRDIGTATRTGSYARPISSISLLATAKASEDAGSTPTTIVWRRGSCAHIVVVRGRCPDAAGEAMVDEDTVHETPHWRLGDRLRLNRLIVTPKGDLIDGEVAGSATIVGTYRPRDITAGYWFGHYYFGARLGPAATSGAKGIADAVLVDKAQWAHVPAGIPGAVEIDVPLDARAVHLADVPGLRARVAALQHRLPLETGSAHRPALRTALPASLAVAAHAHHEVNAASLVVVLEMAALSLLVLYQVVGGAVEARGDEIALAKLRGLRPFRCVLFALGESITLLVIAMPAGLLVALGVTHLLADRALVAGSPVVLDGATGYALLAAFGGSALAAGAATVRTLTRPVLDQWRMTVRRRRRHGLLLLVDLALAAAAVGAVLGMRSGSSRPAAAFLLAPALLVFAVALLGVRLLPWVARLGLSPTRASGNIASFLALRQTVRRPAGLRLAALLAVAAGLATFAVCGEAVARANREARAQTELGAARQVSVQFAFGHDPQTAVDRADPDGRWAMTTATWSPESPPPAQNSGVTVIGELLGVEADRLATTAYPVRGQLAPGSLAAAITAAHARPVAFRATRLRVRLTATALHGRPPTVELDVRRQHAPVVAVAAGRLRPGSHAYSADVDCAAGCSFAGITFDRPIDDIAVMSGSVTVHAVDAGGSPRPLDVQLDRAAAWRSGRIGPGASARVVRAHSGALDVRYRSTGGSSAVLHYADSPAQLPVVATPASVNALRPTGLVADYSNTTVPYRVRSWQRVLPAVLDDGAVANLDYLRTRLPDFDREASWSVWLAPDAPGDALARLRRAGLLVQHVRTEADRVSELGRQGPALGLLLLLVCAVASAALAVGGTAVALMASSRRRAFEFAALRAVGVGHRALRRSAVVEQAMLLGAAVLLGLPGGYLAAWLVLPAVPEFSDATPVALRYVPSVLAALGCGAVLVVLLGVTAVVAGSALARAAVPTRLREAPR